MENFENELGQILESDGISADDKLIDFESWDSLTCLAIIVWAEKRYKTVLSAQEIVNSATIGGLKDLIEIKLGNRP